MWIFIWLVLSSIIIGTTVWSLSILFRQKKAWETYAKRHGLSFNLGTFMGPAEMSGKIGAYDVSFFTAERDTGNQRTRRYVSAIEIQRTGAFIDGGAAGTAEMLPFLNTLTLLSPFAPSHPLWESGFHFFIRNEEALRQYLSPERLETIATLLKTRNADVLVLFNDEDLVLRIETSDPMQDPEKIEKIVSRLIKLLDKMDPTEDDLKKQNLLKQTAQKTEETKPQEPEKQEREASPSEDKAAEQAPTPSESKQE